MSSLIGLDWGTSSLRAYLLDGAGGIEETRHRPWGLRHLPDGGFNAALSAITESWPTLPRLACGMVGSRAGWREMPYLDLPAGAAEIGHALGRLTAADGMDVHIAPGLRDPQGPDVMRGEETQLVGALALRPSLAGASNWILPGTHSKWATVRDGAVAGFRTLMTGELFALLQKHSILGSGTTPAVANPDAFARGVIATRDSGAAGVLSRLFSARTLMLDGSLAPEAVPDYLSGLLVGEEFRAALADGLAHHGTPLQLIGDAALCERYRRAATHFDIELDPSLEDAAAQGLWQLARHAGLVHQAPEEISSC